ncbi:hypothetical protein V2J09_022607 [Rumex salicifolius]
MSPGNSRLSLPENLEDGGRWYFSRKELEENPPSRSDGIDLRKETYLRKAYCTFLQDLGMKLKVPQVTIATAIIFCHRFYLRQSHAKNDRRTIATACMFLAGKVEETPRPLKDVILVSFEIINKKDPAAIQKIKQKEVYEQQKELILLAERVVLANLGFDMNVQHPYKPLVEAIKKFKVAQNALAQVAWNFVNDGLRTSLCLQFEPHHIAAGAIFLAAKFLKVKLPSDGEKVWWQEFDVTPRQLEEVSNQMLELYEQNRVPAVQTSEADCSTVGGTAEKGTAKGLIEEQVGHANTSLAGGSSRSGASKLLPTHLDSEPVDNHSSLPKSTPSGCSDYKSSMTDTPNNKEREERKVSGPSPLCEDGEDDHHMTCVSDRDDAQRGSSHNRAREGSKPQKRIIEGKETITMQSTPEVIKKFDEDKLKQLREKRKKSRGDAVRRTDTMDDFDPIVKELEDGVELAAAESEKFNQERKQRASYKGVQSDMENVEEGELSAFGNSNSGYQSPKPTDLKRKAGSPMEKTSDGKQLHDESRLSRHGHTDRDHKRRVLENHI